ncbi:MAG: hypothetical protein IPP83_16150 [Flavobacteriales bacterium]|nr:hypothetical protein [Flavobacteriales bacterium]
MCCWKAVECAVPNRSSYPDLGELLIAPAVVRVAGAARWWRRVWLVDQKLSKAHGWYRSINEQVKTFLTDFE